MAVETLGLRHLHLHVSDQARSVEFYRHVFGMEVSFQDGSILFLRSPGCSDDLALHLSETDEEKAKVGHSVGVDHFGIIVADRHRLCQAIALVEEAGGAFLRRGEHAPGVPYAYVADPDGYVIEL